MLTPAQSVIQSRADSNYTNSPKKIQDVISDNCWHGHRCFIIGGGESLHNFSFSQLDQEHTIGINKSFTKYDSSILFFSDSNFLTTIASDYETQLQWNAFPNPKVTVAPVEIGKTFSDVYVAKKSCLLELPRCLDDGINVWNNSGFGALVLAYLLGANPIYLLGFDLKCVNTTHWHDGYDGQTIESQNLRMHSFMMPFNMTADEFKHNGIHIVNLNPDSALTCYHKTTLNKVL